MNKLEKLEKQYKKLGEEIEKLKKEKEEINLYDLFEFGGFEWYVIAKDNDNLTLLMKDKLTSNQMTKYFDRKLLDGDYDIPFNQNSSNVWCDSQIRMALNSKFLEELDTTKMRLMATTLISHNKEYITKDYVRLLTKEELDKLPNDILKCSGQYGYWTMSPSSYGHSNHVWFVYSAGSLNSNYASNSNGVRPVIYLTSDIIDACEITEVNGSNGLVNKRVWRVTNE